MQRTKNQDRVSIEIEVAKNGEPFGVVGWANRGRQVAINPQVGHQHDEIEILTKAVRTRNGRPWDRLSFRSLVKDFNAAGYAARIVRDEYRPEFHCLTVADVPFAQLTHAFWRPQALHFDTRKSLEEKKEKRGSELHHLEADVWPREETWVNKVLDAVMTACPPSAVAEALGPILRDVRLIEPSYGRSKARALADCIGDPDFALWDERTRTLILGESKIAGKKTNGRYSFDQFSKYMLHGALVMLPLDVADVVHMVIAASDRPAEFCDDAGQWLDHPEKSVCGQLRVRDAFKLSAKVGRKERPYRDLTTWKEYARERLADSEWREANGGYTEADVDQTLKAETPVLVPTFVVTWDRLCRELETSCASHHAGHLAPAIEKLRRFGNGESLGVETAGGQPTAGDARRY